MPEEMGLAQDASLNSAQEEADACFDNNPVGQPVAACAIRHWISMQLVRQPDLKARPAWWPVPQASPYSSERYAAEITDGKRAGSLDGQGSVRFDDIPAGSCQVRGSKQFYREIDEYFDDQLDPS